LSRSFYLHFSCQQQQQQAGNRQSFGKQQTECVQSYCCGKKQLMLVDDGEKQQAHKYAQEDALKHEKGISFKFQLKLIVIVVIADR